MTGVLSKATGMPGKQLKDALARGAILINGRSCDTDDNTDLAGCFAVENSLYGRYFLVRIGKKKYHLFESE